MIDTFSRALIAGMYRDALHAAEDMARIGNFDMARRELASAAEKLTQLESLTTPTERGHSCPPPATPNGLSNTAQGCEPRATLGNPPQAFSNPEGVAPPTIDI